eukprot:Mycagemm_TRINITY_DN10312_c3_g13::TRINITY_DN10312_c3_g13_i1::g.1046::m.1046 type:complete len:111 gc:universal TRINITY_DN10312_c3_g13_i1:151-483(+)
MLVMRSGEVTSYLRCRSLSCSTAFQSRSTLASSGTPGTTRNSSGLPSSLRQIESSCTRSQNLYVSQHTRNGTLYAFAISAIIAVPTRDNKPPLFIIAAAPTNTFLTPFIT